MKKSSILLISLALLLLFTSSAFAAQASYFNSTVGKTYYNSTTVSTVSSTYSVVYDASGLVRLHSTNKFSAADNETHYPYEIYLPNESRPDQYRIHTNYTKNTDACASCHATHTAVGPSLLQWYTVYETCIACHDGTVATTYNVVGGVIPGPGGKPTYGGMFGLGNEDSLSSHNVTGAVTIAAAPGGSSVAENAPKGYGVQYQAWTATFGCESCHTPHGQGGNARILNPDPNGYATIDNKHDGYTVDASNNYAIEYNGELTPIITGYPYKPVIKNGAGVDITADYIFRNDAKDTVTERAYTYIVARPGKNIALVHHIDGAVIPYQVKMKITNYLGLGGAEVVKHVYGINDYCGACHYDYNTEPQVEVNGVDKIMDTSSNRPGYGNEYGKFSKAHRHSVGIKWNYAGAADTGYIGWTNKPMMTQGLGEDGNDATSASAGEPDSYISCLTCHFAHGTSEDFWGRWLSKAEFTGFTAWDPTELKEISGSSALKRLPNMGTCEACHQKGLDAQGYNINSGDGSSPNSPANVGEGIFTLGNYKGFTVVESDDCESSVCHKGMLAPYANTVMGDAIGTSVTCEACHTGGNLLNSGNHIIQPSADNIVNPRLKDAPTQSAICLQCHDGNIPVGLGGGTAPDISASWSADSHKASDVISCTTCHDVHKLSTEGMTLKREFNALCSSCHEKTYDLGNTFHN